MPSQLGRSKGIEGDLLVSCINTIICYDDNIFLSIFTPLLGWHTATTIHSPRCILIIYDSEILIPLEVLGRDWHPITTSYSLK